MKRRSAARPKRKAAGALGEYRRKRRFDRTPEPAGGDAAASGGHSFVIQKHAATRLHYDVRLELDGTLKSWAVPKGPSLAPGEKRLAVHVEDHPVAYGEFEGIIPAGEYGGGTVLLWDRGTWEPVADARRDYADGKLKFRLHGAKLRGAWMLVRMSGPRSDGGKNWLLFKERDAEARAPGAPEIVDELPHSVASGRTLEEIAAARERAWIDGAAQPPPAAVRVKSPRRDRPRGGRSTAPRVLTGIAAPPPDFAALPGARPAPRPAELRPQLATLVPTPPTGDDWLHEVKYDGYRLLAFVGDDGVRLVTRNGNDWTDRFPEIAAAVRSLPVGDAVLDGELVALRPDGTTDFQALQNALRSRHRPTLAYYLFDVPYGGGHDLARVPLEQRKAALAALLGATPPDPLRYSQHVRGRGPDVLAEACRLVMEGVVSKHAASFYEQRRSRHWLKVKCGLGQEFVVLGYTDPGGGRTGFGALLLGYYDQNELVYCGRVGTGFSEQTLRDLHRRLRHLSGPRPRLRNPPRGRGLHWVRPELVAQVDFTEWTADGQLRHPTFRGLRADRSPRDVTREQTVTTPRTRPGRAATAAPTRARRTPTRTADPVSVAGVKLTNPQRVLYPEQNVTKLDLARYYERVAEFILPHVAGRPLSVVRCPQGHGDKCFYQKHVGATFKAPIGGVRIQEQHKQATYVLIEDLPGLVALVQYGVLEIHPWGSRADRLEQPDRLVFDLDPAPDVAWERVTTAARAVRDRLAALGLESFVKTSGGKGLHVVVPLRPHADWNIVREFSEQVVRSLVRAAPTAYLATMSKAKRQGKIFIDYFRNVRGATSVAPYSTRARAGASVSAPLAWDELDDPDLRADTFTVLNTPARLASLRRDPWRGFLSARQSLTQKLMRAAATPHH